MSDLVAVGLALIFLALSWELIEVCQRLMGR